MNLINQYDKTTIKIYVMEQIIEYLKKEHAKGIIDFHLRISIDDTKVFHFYIHPQYEGGETLDIYEDKEAAVCGKAG